MEKKLNYYEYEVNRVHFDTEYLPTIKIKGTTTETKWMNLNKESAEVIVRKLINEFKLEIK